MRHSVFGYDIRLTGESNHRGGRRQDMKKILSVLTIVVALSGIAASCFSGEGADLLLIDVRTEAEWNSGHIRGAILIPYEQIGKRIAAVAKDKSRKIYVYCRSGRRSQIAKETLDRLGYKNVINLGGLQDAAKAMRLDIVK